MQVPYQHAALTCLSNTFDTHTNTHTHAHTLTQEGMRWLESAHEDKARCWVGFNAPFSHR